MRLIGAGYMWFNALTNDHLSGWQGESDAGGLTYRSKVRMVT